MKARPWADWNPLPAAAVPTPSPALYQLLQAWAEGRLPFKTAGERSPQRNIHQHRPFSKGWRGNGNKRFAEQPRLQLTDSMPARCGAPEGREGRERVSVCICMCESMCEHMHVSTHVCG